jgi:uncharacterized protein (DUF58 family)
MSDSGPRLQVDYLVSPRWIGVLALIAIVSLLTRQVAIFFVGAVLLLALAISWLWGRYCLDGLSYSRAYSSEAVAFGEEVTLSVTIVNRKLLPLAWLEIEDELPDTVTLLRGDLLPSWKRGRGILRQLLSLRWYERVTRRYHLRCATRGPQIFGPVELRSGDLFGLAKRRLALPLRQSVLVYPKVVPVETLGLPSRFPLGDDRSPNRLFQDPLRVAGIRPYTQGDSIRHVHWKASARVGMLQVKTFDPSATLRAMLFLNVTTTTDAWGGVYEDLLELAICVAASLANHLAGQRSQFGMAANTLLPGTAGPAQAPASRSPRQLTALLHILALIEPLMAYPFARLLATERKRVPAGATIVVITGVVDDRLLEQAHAYRAGGHPVTLLLVGDDLRETRAPGLVTHWIGDEAHWRDLSAVRPQSRRHAYGEAASCSS